MIPGAYEPGSAMSALPSSHRTLLLRLAFTSEAFQKLELLSPSAGALVCLRRITKKGPQKENPDLFDTADVGIETAKQGGIAFLRDYRLVRRRTAIGSSYGALRDASLYGAFLADNVPHLEDAEALFLLAERTVDAFAERAGASAVVLLKGLYLIVRHEGYAVRESWWAGLPGRLKGPVRDCLNTPVSDVGNADTERLCLEASALLLDWIGRETDLAVPGN